jgi:hypothetical protein
MIVTGPQVRRDPVAAAERIAAAARDRRTVTMPTTARREGQS